MPLSGKSAWVLVCVSVLGVAGCDEGAGEKRVREQVDKSHRLALSGTTESLEEARQILETVSSDTSASVATQANAKSLLAQVELEAARAAQRMMSRPTSGAR